MVFLPVNPGLFPDMPKVRGTGDRLSAASPFFLILPIGSSETSSIGSIELVKITIISKPIGGITHGSEETEILRRAAWRFFPDGGAGRLGVLDHRLDAPLVRAG